MANYTGAPNLVPVSALDGFARVHEFLCRKVTAGDTIDVGAWQPTPKLAAFVGVTVSAFVGASIAGTVITVPSGASNDTAFLIVVGP